MLNQIELLKIALAHDSFTQEGGAERVIEAFHEMFPKAPIFTLVIDPKLKGRYQSWDIRTSWLQILYNFVPKLQYLLPLIPFAVSSLDFSGYDIVISSSSSWIKNINVPKNCVHINYCHTPTRFLWNEPEYITQEVPVIIRPLARILLHWMKKWDYKGAGRVKYFIANSQEVQKRIGNFYCRESQIIYPFIETRVWHPTFPKSDYFLIVGRLQAHKKNKIIIEIFNELGLPLRVVGAGRQEKLLKSIAKKNIRFLGHISDEQLRDEYSGALGLIYPQAEDFGLVPLEAAACGTATLGYGRAGLLETIIPGETGELFKEYDKKIIARMILNWNFEKYQASALVAQAQKFSKEKFNRNIVNFLNSI